VVGLEAAAPRWNLSQQTQSCGSLEAFFEKISACLHDVLARNF
jgi:hypothetical protein